MLFKILLLLVSFNCLAVGSGSPLHMLANMIFEAPVTARTTGLNDCGFIALRLERTAAIEQVILEIQRGNQTVIQMIRFEVIAETGNEQPTIANLINYLRRHYLVEQDMLWYGCDQGPGQATAISDFPKNADFSNSLILG